MNEKQIKKLFITGLVVLVSLFVLIPVFITLALNGDFSKGKDKNSYVASSVSEINGIQYIDITAKGGFSPANVVAKANMDTTLRVRTKNTFDCSSSIVIPSLNYRSNLPQTGTTEIQIPKQEADTALQGTCSMGMYRFNIKFI